MNTLRGLVIYLNICEELKMRREVDCDIGIRLSGPITHGMRLDTEQIVALVTPVVLLRDDLFRDQSRKTSS
jgi:hypothetical protein